ncbi:hypothetical protein TNCV_4106571 [Trichonephila clavipes]|nr:hypothetical protein TNCV_4106571 [Trichonephila clavipes]
MESNHDNPSSYAALIPSEFLEKMGVATMQQPPYSPDLAPAPFFLFQKLEKLGMECWRRVTAEIQERFPQCQNLAQKYAFLRPEVILSMDEHSLDQVPPDINKEEFQLESMSSSFRSCNKPRL